MVDQILLGDLERLEGLMTKFDGRRFLMQICFSFDKTGSMGSYIAAVGTFIQDAMKTLQQHLQKWLDFEFSLVGYRDFNEKYEQQDFISDIQHLEQIINRWSGEVSGGGDQCEDVAEGLRMVTKLTWKPEALKICVLIADAPSHGKQYSGGADDHYPEQPDRLLEDILADQFKFQGIRLILVELNKSTQVMYDKMKSAYPYSYYVKVDKEKAMITVILTGIVDVVKQFEKDPKLFKTGLDFHTIAQNFQVENVRLIGKRIQKYSEGELKKMFLSGNRFIMEKGEINPIIVDQVLQIWEKLDKEKIGKLDRRSVIILVEEVCAHYKKTANQGIISDSFDAHCDDDEFLELEKIFEVLKCFSLC